VGRSGWNTLFEKVIGHLRFGDKLRTEEELLSELYHPDREVRKEAAGDLTDGLGKNNHILTHIYNTLAADKMISDRLRSYPSWISSMNLSNQVDDATVDTLIEVVTGRYELVQRYYRVKRDLLGLDTLFDYDRYAPVPGLPDKKFSWDECRAIVLKGFGAFSPRMEGGRRSFFH
jgi:oligoendopeptidase F